MAEPFKSLARGAWGSERIPDCSSPLVAGIAGSVFTAIMNGEVGAEGLGLLEPVLIHFPTITAENAAVIRAAAPEALLLTQSMLIARARRHTDDLAAPACDGSGPPSCAICGSLTARQSDCAGRLYGAAVTGTLDLGNQQDCWLFLVTGSDAVRGLVWDDFAAARAAAIRMIQARARRPVASPPPAAAAA